MHVCLFFFFFIVYFIVNCVKVHVYEPASVNHYYTIGMLEVIVAL